MSIDKIEKGTDILDHAFILKKLMFSSTILQLENIEDS
jgi:hypothetical protein